MQRGALLAQALAPGPLPLAPAAWADGGWPRDGPCNALSPEGPSCDWLLQKGPASDDLDALLPTQTLAYLGPTLLKHGYNLCSKLHLDEEKIDRFFALLGAGYRTPPDVPYHTAAHASDVMHTVATETSNK